MTDGRPTGSYSPVEVRVAKIKARAEVKRIPNHVHGTLRGYFKYQCLCTSCCKAATAQWAKHNK